MTEACYPETQLPNIQVTDKNAKVQIEVLVISNSANIIRSSKHKMVFSEMFKI